MLEFLCDKMVILEVACMVESLHVVKRVFKIIGSLHMVEGACDIFPVAGESRA